LVRPADIQAKYAIEREKFDEIASRESLDETAVLPPGEDFLSFARRSSYHPGIAEFLGDLDGRRVLELGCGVGHATVLLAKSGAIVSSFDISEHSVAVTRRRAELNGVADRVDVRVAVAEDLPYEDGAFDVIYGSAILHHVEVDVAGPEIYRVLAAGGQAAFSEPLANNRVVEFARDHVWYPRKAKDGADAPLTYAGLARWVAQFDRAEFHELHLLGMLERLTGWRWEFTKLHALDARLTARWPYLRRFCNTAVILARKEG
jgi:SAM-dependent methyltransferase